MIANRDAAARSERQLVARAIVLHQRRRNLERVLDRCRAIESPIARRLTRARPPTGSSRAAAATPTARRRRCRSPADRARRPAAAMRPSTSSASRSRMALRVLGAVQAGGRRRGPGRGWRPPPRRARFRARTWRARRSSASGRGSPGGGISRVRSLRATFSQVSASWPTRARSSPSSDEPRRLQLLVVAGDAVAIDERAQCVGRRCRAAWADGLDRRGRRALDARRTRVSSEIAD